MAAFEFGNYPERPGRPSFGPGPAQGAHASAPEPAFGQTEHHHHHAGTPEPRLRSEPLLTMKIYDSCRHKNCLAAPEIGPCRHASGPDAGEIIVPPHGARTAHIEDLRIRRIVISNKEPSQFRKGFWNVDIRYIFDYELRFVGDDGKFLCKESATNSFTRRCSLFGSVGAEVSMATDIFPHAETTMGGEPFVMVEAKAMGLAAEIIHRHHRDEARLQATIGLFSIIKLYRMVSLLVESRGFVIPPSCGDVCPPNPCDFFGELAFPMDSFAPPQRREFMAGVSGDIPNELRAEALGEASAE